MYHWGPDNTTWIRYQTVAGSQERTTNSQHAIGGPSNQCFASLNKSDICNVMSQNRPLLLPHSCRRAKLGAKNARISELTVDPQPHLHTHLGIRDRDTVFHICKARYPVARPEFSACVQHSCPSPFTGWLCQFSFSFPTPNSDGKGVRTSFVHRLISPSSPSDTTPESFSIHATDTTFWTWASFASSA